MPLTRQSLPQPATPISAAHPSALPWVCPSASVARESRVSLCPSLRPYRTSKNPRYVRTVGHLLPLCTTADQLRRILNLSGPKIPAEGQEVLPRETTHLHRTRRARPIKDPPSACSNESTSVGFLGHQRLIRSRPRGGGERRVPRFGRIDHRAVSHLHLHHAREVKRSRRNHACFAVARPERDERQQSATYDTHQPLWSTHRAHLQPNDYRTQGTIERHVAFEGKSE